MRHYSCIVQKVAIALLYSFDSGLEHMLGLAVNTYANGQLNSAFRCSFEQREQPMTCRVLGFVWILIKASYLFLIDSDRENFLFLEFVWVIFVSFDNHESMIFVQSYFGGHEKNFGEEVLFFEQFLVIWLLDLPTFISHNRTIIT